MQQDDKSAKPQAQVLTDSYLMHSYKVVPCTRKYAHDWASCPCAHKGERAARRDPQTHGYLAIACQYAKQRQPCPAGDMCAHAHNLFEYWLHPQRFRTELCQFGSNCDRPVCFFEHNSSDLRPLDPSLPPAEACWSAGALLAHRRSSAGGRQQRQHPQQQQQQQQRVLPPGTGVYPGHHMPGSSAAFQQLHGMVPSHQQQQQPGLVYQQQQQPGAMYQQQVPGLVYQQQQQQPGMMLQQQQPLLVVASPQGGFSTGGGPGVASPMYQHMQQQQQQVVLLPAGQGAVAAVQAGYSTVPAASLGLPLAASGTLAYLPGPLPQAPMPNTPSAVQQQQVPLSPQQVQCSPQTGSQPAYMWLQVGGDYASSTGTYLPAGDGGTMQGAVSPVGLLQPVQQFALDSCMPLDQQQQQQQQQGTAVQGGLVLSQAPYQAPDLSGGAGGRIFQTSTLGRAPIGAAALIGSAGALQAGMPDLQQQQQVAGAGNWQFAVQYSPASTTAQVQGVDGVLVDFQNMQLSPGI